MQVDTNVTEKHVASICDPGAGGSITLRNADTHLQVNTALRSRRQTYTRYSLLRRSAV
jgi:hypothetical protein